MTGMVTAPTPGETDMDETSAMTATQAEVDIDETVDETAPVESERSYSQEEVNKIIQQRLERDRRTRRSKTAKKNRKVTHANDAETETQPIEDQGAWRDDFYDAIHGREEFSRIQIRKMRDEFRRSAPTDPDAWVDEWATLFGIGADDALSSEPEQETTNTKQVQNEGTVSKPESNRGSPQPIPDYETVVDPNRLNADDFRRMEQKFGKRAAARKIREMTERYYRGRKIVIPQ